jgi:hypothetical protein
MRMMLTTLYSQWDCLIQMLFDLNCMLSVGYKPETLITLNMAKIWLKVIGVSHCRQVSPLSICGLYMSRCWPLGQLVRSILLSVVTQVLLVDSLVCNWSLSLSIYLSIYLYLSFGDADAIISGRSRLLMVRSHTRTHLRCRLSMKVFTSKARCIPL